MLAMVACYRRDGVVYALIRKVGNRPLGGCVFGERSKTKTEGAEHILVKPKRPKRRANWFCRCVSRPRCRRVRRRNRLAVGCPPYDHQHGFRPVSSVASYRR
ncbi:MAG: hypothetical protein LBQ66_04935 [Planctomycetaceae bacterium]|nr:hypothetical protein [Planctomycetaceae bacterium]